MDGPSLLRLAFADLHSELVEDVGSLDEEALFWQPAPEVNHIGFLLWHIVRDEDTVVCQSVLRRPELWMRGHWDERFALDAAQQGTGFDPEALTNFRYSLGDLMAYAWDVWGQTAEAVGALDAERLGEPLTWSKNWKLANLLTTGCLAHGWTHLGEIRQLRGLRGWRFRE